ncbi:hypothetical protein Scep_022695 [Stephania cephalantha]|uniref:Uncharacterized protein n=1 Tax=Stephania cephalantha TaxID=152367 RepID=A0AAP0F6X1_9MAGN
MSLLLFSAKDKNDVSTYIRCIHLLWMAETKLLFDKFNHLDTMSASSLYNETKHILEPSMPVIKKWNME